MSQPAEAGNTTVQPQEPFNGAPGDAYACSAAATIAREVEQQTERVAA